MDTKLCPKCGETKEHNAFYKNKNGQPRSWCKLCHTTATNKHSRARRAERIKLVHEIKEASPCTDCHKNFPAICMDFDHIGDDKEFDVSKFTNRTWEAVLAEIAKCELVCANCHRLRTHKRNKYWSGRTANG